MSENKEITLEDLGWDKVPQDIIGKSLFDLISLKGRAIVVTGAGGPCLGQAICHSLAGQTIFNGGGSVV